VILAALVTATLVAGAAGGAKRVPALAIDAGLGHTCALTTAGGVRCWGLNDEGQLGDGTTQNRSLPVDVSGLGSGVTAVTAGAFHTCAVTAAGGVKCWGYNRHGELGDGTTTSRLTPVDVSGLSIGVKALAAGGHTCALLVSGGVKCWGQNHFGELGDGTTTNRPTPVDVVGLSSGVAAIAIEDVHTCALMVSGAVKCWGSNTDGELGDGTTTDRSTPVDVAGLSAGVAAVGAGDFQSCALLSAGSVKCWGTNDNGELGNGTAFGSRSLTPVDVVGLSGGKAIAVGWGHACALLSGGGVKCWGYNRNGELGDGGTGNRDRPVDVPGVPAGVAALAAGGVHNCALTRAGGVSCWGDNSYGQLGDGTTGHAAPPTAVTGFGTPSAAVAFATHQARVSPARTAPVSLRCGPEAPCRGTLTLTATVPGKLVGSKSRRVRLTLGVRGFAIPSGATGTVSVVLSPRGYGVLKRAGRLSAQARASYARTPGVPVATTRTIVLVAPR